jgi:hypothetical protein
MNIFRAAVVVVAVVVVVIIGSVTAAIKAILHDMRGVD